MSLNEFFNQFPTKTLTAKETLLNLGDNPSGVYYLQSGHIREFSLSPDGSEITIHIFNPGAFFPLTWALNNVVNTFGFQAITEAKIAIAPRQSLTNFLKANPAVLLELTKRLLAGLNGLSHRLESTLSTSAHDRVFSTLVYLATHFGKKKGHRLLIKYRFTHQQIASLVGVTRERVSLEMERLRQEGKISYKKFSLVGIQYS